MNLCNLNIINNHEALLREIAGNVCKGCTSIHTSCVLFDAAPLSAISSNVVCAIFFFKKSIYKYSKLSICMFFCALPAVMHSKPVNAGLVDHTFLSQYNASYCNTVSHLSVVHCMWFTLISSCHLYFVLEIGFDLQWLIKDVQVIVLVSLLNEKIRALMRILGIFRIKN